MMAPQNHLDERATGGNRARTFRVQVPLSAEEMRALDDFRFDHRMPSRAAAVRELIRRGLQAVGGARRQLRRGNGA